MIEKMKFLSFTGPKKDIDRFVLKYLSKYEIHLENALAQLGQGSEECHALYRGESVPGSFEQGERV